MFLSSASIRHLTKHYNLITLPDDAPPEIRSAFDEQVKFIEGNSWDLHLRQVFIEPFYLKGSKDWGKLLTQTRNIRKCLPLPASDWLLVSGTSYLLQSYEIITPPPGIMAVVWTRTSCFRNHLAQESCKVPAGYSGVITTEAHMASHNLLIELEPGARFASITFHPVMSHESFMNHMITAKRNAERDCDEYAGIWTKNKLTTQGLDERGH